MLKVSLNIGGGSGAYNYVPMFYEFDNSRGFTDFVRDQMFNIILWSHDSHGIKSNLWLGVRIIEDVDKDNYLEWEFIINCKNIREFKQFEKMTREEIDALRVERERDEKLNDIFE